MAKSWLQSVLQIIYDYDELVDRTSNDSDSTNDHSLFQKSGN